ncbi:MAG: DUF3782 domain-containing protein [Candidatus Bathyarchaeia archaeon]
MLGSLKREFLELLDRDVEFRYAVAGYLGLSEILKKLDSLAEEQVKLREEQTKIWIEISKVWEEIKGLREEQTKIWKEIEALREGQARIWEEIARVWREIKDLKEEQARLREDMAAGFRRHDEEIAKLRADMVEGFNLLRRHIDALGARWGLLSEQAFRGGLRGLLERDLGLIVEKWVRYDRDGYVFGYPSDVDIDVAVRDDKVILVEVKSHAGREDLYIFKRKSEFYERVEGKKPARLIIVTPYADREALDASSIFGIEVYTNV